MTCQLRPETVTLQPTTLLDAICVALESGEFIQCRKRVEQGRKRCAWGVIRTVCQRAQSEYLTDVHPQFFEIERRAGKHLGYSGIADANDGGVPFPEIARALRQAREEIDMRRS